MLTQAIETRDVTYNLHSQIEFTNGVTQTRVRERRTDSATSLLEGTTPGPPHLNLAVSSGESNSGR